MSAESGNETRHLLMPKATAVWLVDNTALTFEQIAAFCGLHALEVQGIADGEVAAGIKGLDPIANGQLARDELERAEADPDVRMTMSQPPSDVPADVKRRGPRYVPSSRRGDRPSAIMWLTRNHPELTDAQIGRLSGASKSTISAVRERTHWSAGNLTPMDPVTLGLCSQGDLDEAVAKAARAARERRLEDDGDLADESAEHETLAPPPQFPGRADEDEAL